MSERQQDEHGSPPAEPGVPDAEQTPDEDGTGSQPAGDEASCSACSSGSGMSRRTLMKGAVGGGVAIAGIPPLAELFGPIEDAGEKVYQQIFKKHYKEMTEAEKAEMIEKLEAEYSEEYGTDVDVATTDAQENVVFGYALNIQRCIGCRRCVYGCVEENNQSRRDPDHPSATEIQWIRVLEFDEFEIEPGEPSGGIGTEFGDVDAGINLERSSHYYDEEGVPEEGKFYVPVQCQQCEDPPCVKVCPTQATWKEEDGIVTVDYDWCIGCKYCIVACPYYARRFNLSHPHVPEEELNPDTHYLGNRPRPHEVVEKCTFCIQRTRENEYPACVEVCPVGARKFGNLLDPESEVRKIIDEKRVFRLKEDLGTEPKFFYFMN